MNKSVIIFIAVLVVVTGCSQPGIKGDGAIKTEDRSVSDFSKIEVSGDYKVKWSPGKPELNISADQNLLPLIKTVMDGNTLRIDSEDKLAPTKNIVITLSSVSLTRVQLAGGIDFKASHLFGQALKLETSGASDIGVEGSVTEFEANLMGASHLNAKSLRAQDVKLSLLGASDADITATDTLKVSITGASSVTYSGHPKSVEQNITGAGSVRQR